MSDPHEREGMSVTLKQDGKDGTWIVFHGSPAMIREQILGTFPDLKAEDDTPLFDIVNEATRIYKASGNVTSALGGRVIRGSDASDPPPSPGSAWDRGSNGSSAEPAVDPEVTRITAAIEAAESVDALHDLYARNKSEFDTNEDLMTAWKAKGKSLS